MLKSIEEYEHEALLFAEKYGIIDYKIVRNEMIWIFRNLDLGYSCKGWKHILNLDNKLEKIEVLK